MRTGLTDSPVRRNANWVADRGDAVGHAAYGPCQGRILCTTCGLPLLLETCTRAPSGDAWSGVGLIVGYVPVASSKKPSKSCPSPRTQKGGSVAVQRRRYSAMMSIVYIHRPSNSTLESRGIHRAVGNATPMPTSTHLRHVVRWLDALRAGTLP